MEGGNEDVSGNHCQEAFISFAAWSSEPKSDSDSFHHHFSTSSIEEPVEKVEKGHFKMMMMMIGQTICQYTAEPMNWLINPI